jgi:hypothetical protein
MPWGYIREMPITREQYDELDKRITKDPEGLLLHTAAQTSGGMLIIDVWDSKEANDRFERETLFPALEQHAGFAAEQAPAHNEFDVHKLRGRAAGA